MNKNVLSEEKIHQIKDLLSLLGVVNSVSYKDGDTMGAYRIVEKQLKDTFSVSQDIQSFPWKDFFEEQQNDNPELLTNFWNHLIALYSRFPYRSKTCLTIIDKWLDNDFNPWIDIKQTKNSDHLDDDFERWSWSCSFINILTERYRNKIDESSKNNSSYDHVEEMTMKLLSMEGCPKIDASSSWFHRLFLHLGWSSQKDESIIHLLSKINETHHIDINIPLNDYNQDRLLHEAKNWEQIQWLLKNDVDYNIKNTRGIQAFSNWKPELIERFVEYKKEKSLSHSSLGELSILSMAMDRYWNYIKGEKFHIDDINSKSNKNQSKRKRSWLFYNFEDKKKIYQTLNLTLHSIHPDSGLSMAFMEICSQKYQKSHKILTEGIKNKEINHLHESIRGIPDGIWLFFYLNMMNKETNSSSYKNSLKLLKKDKGFMNSLSKYSYENILKNIKSIVKNEDNPIYKFMSKDILKDAYETGFLELMKFNFENKHGNDHLLTDSASGIKIEFNDHMDEFFNTKEEDFGSLFWCWADFFINNVKDNTIYNLILDESNYSKTNIEKIFVSHKNNAIKEIDDILLPNNKNWLDIIKKGTLYPWDQTQAWYFEKEDLTDTSDYQTAALFFKTLMRSHVLDKVINDKLYNQNLSDHMKCAKWILGEFQNNNNSDKDIELLKKNLQQMEEKYEENNESFSNALDDKSVMELYKSYLLSATLKSHVKDHLLDDSRAVKHKRKL